MSQDRKKINLKMKLTLKMPSQECIYAVIGRCITCLTHAYNRMHFIFPLSLFSVEYLQSIQFMVGVKNFCDINQVHFYFAASRELH